MHPIENILQTTMSELRPMVDVNTIVGDAFVTPAGSTVIPISKVSFGFVTGGAEYADPREGKGKHGENPGESYPFAGGTATGVSIQPVAFLVTEDKNLHLLPTSHRNALDKILEHIPEMMCELKKTILCSCKEMKDNEKESGPSMES